MRFDYDPIGELWHGFGVFDGWPWYDLGIIVVDYYPLAHQLTFYFWRFSITFQLRKSKP